MSCVTERDIEAATCAVKLAQERLDALVRQQHLDNVSELTADLDRKLTAVCAATSSTTRLASTHQSWKQLINKREGEVWIPACPLVAERCPMSLSDSDKTLRVYKNDILYLARALGAAHNAANAVITALDLVKPSA